MSMIKNEKRIKKIVLIILSCMALVSCLQGIKNGMQNPVDFLWPWFKDAMEHKVYDGPQYPFTFWLMFPFGLLPEMPARALWIVCNFIFTGILAWSLRKTFFKDIDKTDYTILILLMISGGPWRTNLSNGQYTLCAVALFFLSVYLSSEGRYYTAGIVLSMCMFKFQLIAPMAVYFLYKRYYKAIATAIVSLAVSFGLNVLWFGNAYDISLYQLKKYSGALSEEGDVDIESLLHLGKYTIPIFIAAIIALVVLAYVLQPSMDEMYITVAMFTAWAASYQRMYNFFPLIIPLGYLYTRRKERKDPLSNIAFCSVALLTALYFWSLTISDYWGRFLIRLVYYPVFAIMIIYIFNENMRVRPAE